MNSEPYIFPGLALVAQALRLPRRDSSRRWFRTPDIVELGLSQFSAIQGGTDHRFSWSVNPSPSKSLTDDKKRSSVPLVSPPRLLGKCLAPSEVRSLGAAAKSGGVTWIALLVLAWTAAAQSGFPFQDETLRYSISWQSGLNLGEAAMAAHKAGKGWVFTVSVNAALPGFTLNDSYHATSDGGLCSQELTRSIDHRGKMDTEKTSFDQMGGSAKRVTEFPAGGGESTFTVPSCARDAVAYVYYARAELGQGRVPPPQEIYFGAAYTVHLTYVGEEKLQVGGKPAVTDHVTVSLKGPKSDTAVEVFFARDAARTPLAIRIPVQMGKLSLELAP
jgi:hypothetical protein